MQATIPVMLIWLARGAVSNVVSTVQGKIRGVPSDGYISYIGIPYGSLDNNGGRFKQPGLAPTWSDIRESRDPFCSSNSEVDNCLQLDVNVPSQGSSLPVLVWVKGTSGNYHPGKFLQQGIIVVIVRHRLGPLGFLCSNEYKIAGNAALKDVVQALRWVRDNIVAFNGNPNKVVVGGQSFGAAMVEALMLTSAAKDLFHGVILQSGTILAPWAFNFDARNRAKVLNMQFNGTDVFRLNQISTIDLVNKAEEINLPYLPFGMCIEGPHKNEERLLTDSPFDLLSSGKAIAVPALIGYNSNEAYIFASALNKANAIRRMMNDMRFILPVELQLQRRETPYLMKTIKDLYFSENETTEKSLLTYHRDAYFLSHIHRSMRLHALNHPVYCYQFSHSGNVGVEEESQLPKWGAAHSDELAYLYPEKGRDLDGDDGVVQQHLVTLWSNFVKHLSPTPDGNNRFMWEPVNPSSPRVLDISTECEMLDFPHAKEMQMWEEIYEKHFFRKRSEIV